MADSEVYAAPAWRVFAVTAAFSLGLVAPFLALFGGAVALDWWDGWRRGRPVAIEVRADDLPGYHLAFLSPGQESRLPPNALADFRKARTVMVRRRP